MNELFFIWGPPHSGQLRWMAKDYEASVEYGIHSVILPLKDLGEEDALKNQLNLVEAQLKTPSKEGVTGHHVFCELPWSVLDEDLDLEEWIENVYKKYAVHSNKEWNATFVCICPYEAHKLPIQYKEGLENFARGSHSVVVVVKREAEQADPAWLQNNQVDFGRHIEILEDYIWPLKGELPMGEQGAMDLSKRDKLFENFEIPLAPDRTQVRNLLIEMSKGTFGKFWGAEASWRNPEGQFEALSLVENRIYSWTSDHPSLIEMSSLNGARLTASGFDVNWDLLKKSITSIQRFC